jgi:hypothetical protein
MEKLIITLALVFVFVPAALWADTQGKETNTFQQFQQEENKAYASYRRALFQTNKKTRPNHWKAR